MPTRIRQLFRFLGRTLLLMVALLGVLIASLVIDHFRVTQLPAPSGAFAVGRTSLRMIVPATGALTTHEVFAWVWYPTDANSGTPAEYMPTRWRRAVERWDGLPGKVVSRDLGRVVPFSREGATIRAGEPLPIVLFRGGLSTLGPEYTVLAEEMASRGHIVVALDAPERSLVFVHSDGRVVTRSAENDADAAENVETLQQMLPRLASEWAADAGAVLDKLASLNVDRTQPFWFSHLDLHRVAMIGHSLGGAAALQFCRQDERCTSAVDIDGLVSPDIARGGVRTPTLFLMGEHPKSELNDPVNRLIWADIENAVARSVHGLVARESMPGANHYNFSDGAVTKSHVLMALLRALKIVHMNPVQQLRETADRCVRFLDAQWTGKGGSLVR